jgi:ABC-type transport system substrate-binding protein
MDDPVLGHPAGERGKKLRQAMCLAYDQKLWIDRMRNGFWAEPAFGPTPKGIAGYLDDVKSKYTARDLDAAKRLLAEAGYPDGKGLPEFDYEMSGSDTVSRIGAEIYRNCMADIGVRVNLHANTWDQFDDKVKGRRAQLFGMAWSADYPDAQNFLQLFYGPFGSPNANGSNYNNPAYDKLYDEMKLMQPGPARDDVIRKMLAIVNEDCPMNYTDHRIAYSYARSWLKNFKYMDVNPWLFKYYRVDKDEKTRVLAAKVQPR